VVQIFDSGLDDRSGQHFIVMEYIEGSSCAEILRDQGWVEVPEAVSIIEQACEGLYYAHRHGVVHRDVKPGNLLRSLEGQVKLADFGIAKATEQSSITQVGSVLGTAAYLAPEQARGEEAGPGADLYALGVVAYQLISGRLPYEAASLTELALKQQEQEPARLDTLVAAVPTTLSDAVARSLALEPSERFANAHDMAGAVVEGSRGVATEAPDPNATRATTLLPAAPRGATRGPQTSSHALTPRRAAPGEVRRPATGPAAAPSPSHWGRRAVAALVAVAAIAVAVAAVIVATTPQSEIRIRQVVYPKTAETATALRQLVAENTK
jgi:serine/threonine-protein kinase